MAKWKKYILLGLSTGAGFAIMFCLIAGGFYWYGNRPKPWNKDAITATFDQIRTEGSENKTLVFFYTLQNNTNRDYKAEVQSHLATLVKLKKQESLSGLTDGKEYLSIDLPIFIPPKQRLRFGLHLKYSYKGPEYRPDFTEEELEKYRQGLEAYISEKLKNLDGFVVYDEKNRYQIDLPKGW
jgi:hypothetical protein